MIMPPAPAQRLLKVPRMTMQDIAHVADLIRRPVLVALDAQAPPPVQPSSAPEHGCTRNLCEQPIYVALETGNKACDACVACAGAAADLATGAPAPSGAARSADRSVTATSQACGGFLRAPTGVHVDGNLRTRQQEGERCRRAR